MEHTGTRVPSMSEAKTAFGLLFKKSSRMGTIVSFKVIGSYRQKHNLSGHIRVLRLVYGGEMLKKSHV